MRRHVLTARPDYVERLHTLGFELVDGAEREYWNEAAAWELTAGEVAMLEAVTLELHALCLHAAGYAADHDLYDVLGIPPAYWPVVKASWRRGDPSLYGRMDLRWDGHTPPQLLEYNADTPTALYEASVLQWDWLEATRPAADQFNGLHETLIQRWHAVARGEMVHFTCIPEHLEDRITVEYMRDTAVQAGSAAPFIDVSDIGWDGARFVDMDGRPMRHAFKLYPTEWMLQEQFGGHLAQSGTQWPGTQWPGTQWPGTQWPGTQWPGTQWIEPPWRLMLASKGILALLWQLNPGHPNLLPAYREPGRTGRPEIAKPLFGREGANIRAPGWETDGPFGGDPYVFQVWNELPCVGGMYPVFGSWVIGDRACGLGVREDTTPITRDTSCFVPHFFMPPLPQA
jgi:glutathionylspermidine synthase